MKRLVTLAGFTALILGVGATMANAADRDREIPAPFAPFEHLVGGWKGVGIPAANRVKGWPEKHMWAWRFVKGTPVGMSLEFQSDKVLSQARLDFDAAKKLYRLEGTDPDGKPVAFVGPIDESGQTLALDRVGDLPSGAKQRLTLRLNSNMIRYVMWIDEQERGAPQFSRVLDVNMGKEGESFAAGGSASNLPKCVLTGGSATMTVTFGGKSYPVCCTGCRDEFLADPEKYVKKAELRAQAEAKNPSKPAASRVIRDDGSFDALLTDSKKSRSRPMPKDAPKGEAPESKPSANTTASPKEAPKDQPTEKPAPAPATDDKAASLLERAQELEKKGNTQAAVIYYRMIAKDYPKSPQAKSAAVRLKALGAK